MNTRLPWLAEALLAALTAAFVLVLAVTVLHLWNADLRQPLEWSGDALLHLTMIRAVDEQGWPLMTVSRLGLPGALDFRDFPAHDALNLLIVRVLSWFTDSPGLLINALYLLTFPLVAAAAFLSARALGLSRPAAFFAGVLYAMLPYHFHRGTGHLFLSAYYLVPPAALAAVELARGGEAFGRRAVLVAAVVLCVLLGGATPYYAYFAAIFLATGAIYGSILRRSSRPLLLGAALVGVMVGTVVLQHAPTLVKETREPSLNVGRRWPAEAELYGLKIAQLVLPVSDHRWGVLADLKTRYCAAPLVNENDTATLGLIGTIGFVVLLFWLFFIRPRQPLLDCLSVLSAAGVLAGTIGGLSALFSLFVSPQIRSVNRISVFIAFFSLVAAGTLFDRLARRSRPALAAAAAVSIAILGSADQTTPTMRRDRGSSQEALARYVARIEASLPRGAAVFQLPHFPFPEHGRVHELGDYDLFRPYAMSEALRFSYGAVRGSRADLWQRFVTAQAPRELARTLALSGFDGVLIERAGYPDGAAGLEREISAVAGAIPFVDEEGRRSFIRLTELRQRLTRQLGPQFAASAARVRSPLLAGFRGGFYGEEVAGAERWNWSGGEGSIVVYNDLGVPRQASVTMSVAGASGEPSVLWIRASFWNERLPLGEGAARIERRLTIPPGMHVVSLRSDGRPRYARGDPRAFVFRVIDFRMEETSSVAGAARRAS